MKIKISRPEIHVFYWMSVIIILTLAFGHSWNNRMAAFYFVAILLPVVTGTSYFFNFYLIPEFLFKKKYFKFGLYTFYTFIISLYLESLVLIVSFIYLGNFSFQNMAPRASDTLVLAAVMYIIVLLGSFLVMVLQITAKQKQISSLINEQNRSIPAFLEVISSRKMVKIPHEDITYIESMADYIYIHTISDIIKSKEKISVMEKKLPPYFLRIHRSFIINVQKITSSGNNEIVVAEKEFTIGRSYKPTVHAFLKKH